MKTPFNPDFDPYPPYLESTITFTFYSLLRDDVESEYTAIMVDLESTFWRRKTGFSDCVRS
jgi:hypothetical protein